MVISLACHQQKKSEVTSALVGVGSVAAELPLYEARKEYRSTSALAGLHSNTAPLPEGGSLHPRGHRDVVLFYSRVK